MHSDLMLSNLWKLSKYSLTENSCVTCLVTKGNNSEFDNLGTLLANVQKCLFPLR